MSESKDVDSIWTQKVHKSPVFECTSCKFKTSGIIIPEVDAKKRLCPTCRRILVWCHDCRKYISANKTEPITCSKCGIPILEKHFNNFNQN